MRPTEEINRHIDGYMKHIKHKAECVIAFSQEGICHHLLIRDENTIKQLEHINKLMGEVLSELPVKIGTKE